MDERQLMIFDKVGGRAMGQLVPILPGLGRIKRQLRIFQLAGVLRQSAFRTPQSGRSRRRGG